MVNCVLIEIVNYLILVLIWRRNSSSKRNRKLSWTQWVTLIMTDKWVQRVEKLFLNEVISNCSIFHLSILYWYMINLRVNWYYEVLIFRELLIKMHPLQNQNARILGMHIPLLSLRRINWSHQQMFHLV